MRILMYGWEFPPRISGGLGTACYGLTKALAAAGHRITFVLPKLPEGTASTLDIAPGGPLPAAGDEPPWLELRPVPAMLAPYGGGPHHYLTPAGAGQTELYGRDLVAEARRFGAKAGGLAGEIPCDVIHAHDWMTIPAALEARRLCGRPLVLHIHSLEYDRSGEAVNGAVLEIEKEGLRQADHVIAVSHRTRKMIEERYGVTPMKISVVHNAVTKKEGLAVYRGERRRQERPGKMVLYLGRITFQKGPDYFLEAAAEVLKVLPETTFVMAGSGDMLPRMIERAAELGIGSRVRFPGFLQGEEVERIFLMSDLYVMPSVSEPFGISPLEAMMYDVPVIISRQSGVAEILHHALKVDFWDVRALAALIVSVLKRPPLASEMTQRAGEELRRIKWETAAGIVGRIYEGLSAPKGG